MKCEKCPYRVNLGNSSGDLGFKCGLDYCPQECLMFDCTPEENARSHARQKEERNESTSNTEG